MVKNIAPKKERKKEIEKILMDPKNKVARHLKKFQLYDGPDPKDQDHYKPLDVAAIVAWAELGKKIHSDALENFKKAKNNLKIEKRRVHRKIKSIEKTTKQNFSDLPEKVRLKSYFKNKEITGRYHDALVKKEITKFKRNKLIQGKRRPKEKYLDTFCLELKKLFLERTGRPPNYKLVADLANLFHLSHVTQTSNTIRQRIHQLPRKK